MYVPIHWRTRVSVVALLEYRSTEARSPRQQPIRAPQTLTEITGPTDVWDRLMEPVAIDLTTQHGVFRSASASW